MIYIFTYFSHDYHLQLRSELTVETDSHPLGVMGEVLTTTIHLKMSHLMTELTVLRKGKRMTELNDLVFHDCWV